MKRKVLRWGAWACLAAAPAFRVSADDAPAPAVLKSGSPISAPAGPITVAPPAPVDGIDNSTIVDPEEVMAHTMEIQAEQRSSARQLSYEESRADAQRVNNDDSLLKDYQARLKKEGLAPAENPDGISSTPLPRRASDTVAPNPLGESQPRTASLADPAKMADSPFASSDQNQNPEPAKPFATSFMQPLLPPLATASGSSPAHAGVWGPADSVAEMSSAPDLTLPSSLGGDRSANASSMDVPGLTAAEGGVGTSASRAALGLEGPLPEESPAERQADRDSRNNFLVPTAPTNDVTEFFKKQAEALRPAVAPTLMRPATAAAPVVRAPEAKVKPQPVITGLRTHVADPFDILGR